MVDQEFLLESLSFDLKRLLTPNTEPDGTVLMREVGLCKAGSKETMLVEDDTNLDDGREQKQPRQDIQGIASQGLVGGKVSPEGVDGEHRQGMVCTKEEFVGGSAKDRNRKQNNAPQ